MSTSMARAVRQLASTGRMSSLAIPVLADAADHIDTLTAERDALKEELRTIRAGDGITEPTDSPTAAVNEASEKTASPESRLPLVVTTALATDDVDAACGVADRNGWIVADMLRSAHDGDDVEAADRAREFAAFIVRACNSHAELRAALNRLVAHTTNGACRADPELSAAYAAAIGLLVRLNDAEEGEVTHGV
jgi:hypothetical protein